MSRLHVAGVQLGFGNSRTPMRTGLGEGWQNGVPSFRVWGTKTGVFYCRCWGCMFFSWNIHLFFFGNQSWCSFLWQISSKPQPHPLNHPNLLKPTLPVSVSYEPHRKLPRLHLAVSWRRISRCQPWGWVGSEAFRKWGPNMVQGRLYTIYNIYIYTCSWWGNMCLNICSLFIYMFYLNGIALVTWEDVWSTCHCTYILDTSFGQSI